MEMYHLLHSYDTTDNAKLLTVWRDAGEEEKDWRCKCGCNNFANQQRLLKPAVEM